MIYQYKDLRKHQIKFKFVNWLKKNQDFRVAKEFIISISELVARKICFVMYIVDIHVTWNGAARWCINCVSDSHVFLSSESWGYSHVKTYGDVPQFWIGFLQEIPKHGSHFSWKNRNCGSDFQKFPGFSEPRQILKVWCIFAAKSQKKKMATLSQKNP